MYVHLSTFSCCTSVFVVDVLCVRLVRIFLFLLAVVVVVVVALVDAAFLLQPTSTHTHFLGTLSSLQVIHRFRGMDPGITTVGGLKEALVT